jgi:cytochrome c-type biogenesis protein CcmH/NrfF
MNTKLSSRGRGLSPATIVLLMVIGGVGVVTLFSVLSETLRPASEVSMETTADSTIEAQVKLIAVRFSCTCGSCGEEPLDHCTCTTATAVRQEIRERLIAGRSSNEIVAEINRTHGGLRENDVE